MRARCRHEHGGTGGTGGTGIAIAGTVVSLATTGCVAGEVWKYNGAAFSCEPDTDTDTPPVAGNGIAVAGNVRVPLDRRVRRG